KKFLALFLDSLNDKPEVRAGLNKNSMMKNLKYLHRIQDRQLFKSKVANDWVKIQSDLSTFFESCHTIKDLSRQFISLKSFSHYRSCHLLTHEKGKLFSQSFTFVNGQGYSEKKISINDFNSIFNLIKKSKNKSFHSSQTRGLDFIGTFLGREFSLRK